MGTPRVRAARGARGEENGRRRVGRRRLAGRGGGVLRRRVRSRVLGRRRRDDGGGRRVARRRRGVVWRAEAAKREGEEGGGGEDTNAYPGNASAIDHEDSLHGGGDERLVPEARVRARLRRAAAHADRGNENARGFAFQRFGAGDSSSEVSFPSRLIATRSSWTRS